MKEHSYTALEVTYWHPRDATYGRNPLNYVNHIFVKISLDGSSQDQTKLEFGQQMIRRLIQQPWITRGIEFTLNDNVKYASLVALFNICIVEGARWYVHHGNKFWVFNFASTDRKTTTLLTVVCREILRGKETANKKFQTLRTRTAALS